MWDPFDDTSNVTEATFEEIRPPALPLPRTLDVGLHDGIPDDHYRQDPCIAPSLNPSIATILCQHSERHAYDAHPRFGGKCAEAPTKGMDHGSLVHAVLLGGRPTWEINADDYRTKRARAERETARAHGAIPVLSKDLEPLLRLAEVIQKAWPIPTQHREVTLVWQAPTPDGTVLARCRPDALELDLEHKRAAILDLKTTADGTLTQLRNTHVDNGHDIQAAANVQAIETLFPELLGRVWFIDLYVEVGTGYHQPIGFDGPMADFGRRRWSRACRAWRRSLTTGVWRAYARDDGQVQFLDLPVYQLQREVEAYHQMGFTDG